MDRTLGLDEVARLTRQPVDRLRQWCATGLLACDRADGQWALPESQLAAAHALAAVGPRLASSALPDGTRLLAVAFSSPSDARDVLDEIRTRTGVRPSDVELAPLSIDGMPRVLVAGRIPAAHEAAIHAIVLAGGGQLIDGTQRPGRPAAERAGADEPPLERYGA